MMCAALHADQGRRGIRCAPARGGMQATEPTPRPPASVDETIGLVEQVWRTIVDHLPVIVAAVVILLLAYAGGRLARLLTTRALRRHDPTLAGMLGEPGSGGLADRRDLSGHVGRLSDREPPRNS